MDSEKQPSASKGQTRTVQPKLQEHRVNQSSPSPDPIDPQSNPLVRPPRDDSVDSSDHEEEDREFRMRCVRLAFLQNGETDEECQKRCLDEDYDRYSKDLDLMAAYHYLEELHLRYKAPAHTEESDDDAEEEEPREPFLKRISEEEKTELKALFGRILPGRTVDLVLTFAASGQDQAVLQKLQSEAHTLFPGSTAGMVMDFSMGLYVIGARHHPELNKPEYFQYYQLMRMMNSSNSSGGCSIL